MNAVKKNQIKYIYTIKDVHVLNFWTFTFNLERYGMFYGRSYE